MPEENAAADFLQTVAGIASYRMIKQEDFYKTNINYGGPCPASHPYSYKLGQFCCASTVATCTPLAMRGGLGFESKKCFDGSVKCSVAPCYNNNNTVYNTGTVRLKNI